MLHTLIIKIMKSILETKNQKPYIYLSLQYIRCKDNHIFFAIVKHQIENGNFNKYELLFCQKWRKMSVKINSEKCHLMQISGNKFLSMTPPAWQIWIILQMHNFFGNNTSFLSNRSYVFTAFQMYNSLWLILTKMAFIVQKKETIWTSFFVSLLFHLIKGSLSTQHMHCLLRVPCGSLAFFFLFFFICIC